MANVFSLDRTFKVVGTDGRIRGEWVVVLPPSGRGDTVWISPHEVVIYDEGLNSGVILGRRDLTAKVSQCVAELSLMSSNRRDDVEEVREELLALLVEVARVGASEEGTR